MNSSQHLAFFWTADHWPLVTQVDCEIPTDSCPRGRDSGDSSAMPVSGIQKRWVINAAAGILIALMAVRLLVSLKSTGMVTDEFAHIPAAYVYVKQHRFEVNAAHPPLIKYLAGLPLLLLNPPLPNTDPMVEGFAYDSEFLYGLGAQARTVVTLARIPMILIGCLLGLVLYRWTCRLFGPAGGLFSLLLFVFEPNVLAHSRFVLTDIGASLAYLAFWFSAWRWFKTPSFRRSLILSGITGLALLIKHSMVILPFCWALVVVLMVATKKLTARCAMREIAVGTVLIVFVLNAGYCFKSKRFDSADFKTVAGWVGYNADESPVNGFLNRFSPLPIPAAYVPGLDVVVNQNKAGHPAYLMGRYSTRGWWYYFPVALLVKVPLAVLIMFTFALIWLVRFTLRNFADGLFLLGPLLLYGLLAMSSHVDVGIRYILPVFPFLLIAAGGMFELFWQRRRAFRWILMLLAAWLVIASGRISYDPLEYFNELAGGPLNGWRYLADSKLDFGQSFVGLMRYVNDHHLSNVNFYVVGVEYNLAGNTAYNCFLPYRLPDEFRPVFPYSFHETYEQVRPGMYAVSIAKIIDPFVFTSANSADRERGAALFGLLRVQPKVRIGNMIAIYDLGPDDIARAGLSNAKLYYYDGMKFNRDAGGGSSARSFFPALPR